MKLVVKERNSDHVIAAGELDQDVTILENAWYFDPDTVDMTRLRITDRTYNCPYKGICQWIDLVSNDSTTQNIGWIYTDVRPGYEHIHNRPAFFSKGTASTLSERYTTTA